MEKEKDNLCYQCSASGVCHFQDNKKYQEHCPCPVCLVKNMCEDECEKWIRLDEKFCKDGYNGYLWDI